MPSTSQRSSPAATVGAPQALGGLAEAQGTATLQLAFQQAGPCDAIGGVAAELGEVSLPTGARRGAASARPVARGQAEALVALDDVLLIDDAIVVTQDIDTSAEDPVACGAIDGVPGENGEIRLFLRAPRRDAGARPS